MNRSRRPLESPLPPTDDLFRAADARQGQRWRAAADAASGLDGRQRRGKKGTHRQQGMKRIS